MKDPGRQQARPDSFPATDLTDRLLRRANEPIGVIDTRQAEQLHRRTPGWFQQRFELLDNFRILYGIDRNASGSSPALSTAPEHMPFVESYQAKASSRPLSFSPAQPSITRSAILGTVPDVASNAAPTRQFRVKRPSVVSDADRSKRQENVLLSGNQFDPLPHVSEIRAQSSSSSQVHLQRKAVPAAVPTPGSSKADGVAVSRFKNPPSSDLLPQVTELPQASSSKMHLQRLLGPAAVSAPAQSIQARNTTTQNSPVGDQTSPPTVGSLPQVVEMPSARVFSPAEMHLQRSHDRVEGSAAVTSVLAVQLRKGISASSPQADWKTPAGEENCRTAPVSREIRVTPSLPGAAAIVWRKAVRNGDGAQFLTSPTHAGSSQLMRQAATDSSPTAVSASGNATTMVTPSSSRGETDIVYVAERVSRVIARQLVIERERRGKT